MDVQPYPLPRATRETEILDGDGGATYGPFDFKVFDLEDLRAFVKQEDGAWQPAAFAAAKVAGEEFDDFTITFAEPLPETSHYLVQSCRLHERQVAITQGGAIGGRPLEKELSKQGSVIEELRRDIWRGGSILPLRPGQVAIAGDDGRMRPGPDAGDIADAQGNAAVAAAAADVAAAAATDAQEAQLAAESAAGANLANADSVAAAEVTNIPAAVNYIRTAGYAMAGDGGGALYKRAAVEPIHPGKFPSADGAWWEIVLDNGYAHVVWFGAGISALKKAWQVSRKIVCTDGEVYDFAIGDTLTATGESVDIVAGNSVFRAAQDGATFVDVRGVWTDIQDVSLISNNTDFTVDDGSAYKPGDYIKIVDEGVLPEDLDVGKKGEFANIQIVAGNVISIYRGSHYTYSTVDQCRIGKIDKDITCHIDVGKLDIPHDYTSSTLLVYIESFVSPALQIGGVPNLPASTHIGRITSCIGGTTILKPIGSNHIGGPGGVGGYGINLAGTEGHTVKVQLACGIRHAFDAGVANVAPATGLAAYGAAANNVVTGKAYRCRQTPWGTHHGVRGTIFQQCFSFYCYGGVAIRGIGNRAVDCIAYKCASGFSAFNQGGVLSQTDNTVFENCHAIECDGDLVHATGRVDVIGGTYTTNGNLPVTPTRAVGVNGDLRMRGGELVINRQINNRYWNLLAGAISLELRDVVVRVRNNPVPIRMIDNPLSLDVRIVIEGLEIDNPDNTATYILGHSTMPGAGSRFGDIRVVGGMTRLAESLASDSALRPYLTGPVYDLATRKMLRPLAADVDQADIATDAATTLTWGVSPAHVRHTGTLTADRAVTLSTTNAVRGATFRITRTGAGLFALNVGAGPLKALATNEWCEVTFDGAAWYLSAAGGL